MNTTLQQIHLNGEVIDLTEFAKEQTLATIYEAIAEITSRTAIYDATTGNLTLENVQLTINK